MRLPKYRKHSSRDIGFVEWQGDRRYLPGRHNSEESTDAYRAFLRNVVFAKQPDELPNEAAKISSQKNISVCDVIEQFLDYCQGYYPAGSRSEYHNCRRACRLLKEKFSHLPASEFTPKKLKSLRDAMIARGDARTYINWQVNRIKRCFTWAASEDLIPGSVSQSLTTVQGLRAGRTDAREPIKRMPVPWEHVKKVLPHLSPTVRAMVKMHWLTGARSKSVCRSRPEQFKKSRKVWEWRPRHKTEFLGVELVLPVGPRCQKVIRPFIERPTNGYLFSPRTIRPNKRYRKSYSTSSYQHAVNHGFRKLAKSLGMKPHDKGKQTFAEWLAEGGVAYWSPHQLRHSRGEATRSKYGAEAAQAILGHGSLDATEIYSARRLKLAKKVAFEKG